MKTSLMVWIFLLFGLFSAPEIGFTTPFSSGELLVKYKAGMHMAAGKGLLKKIGWVKIKIDSGKNINREMMILKANSNVIDVEPNYYGEFLLIPNDPFFVNQWYLSDINVPEAWDISLGSGVLIGLIDSGVDLAHQDLADNLLPDGWDFGDYDDDPSDELGHGTKVCGVIASIQNNDIGISGCAPEATILPIKISLGNTGSFTDVTVAEGIIYAADYGVKIINLSLGWNDDNTHQVVRDAIDYAIERGVVLVAAAGNNYGPVWFPANYDGVISVSGTDQDGGNDNYAFGPELDLVAPGHGIWTTGINNLYTSSSGTSFSCGIVSGVAALLSYQHPYLTREHIRDYLILRADDLGDVGRDDIFGYGKVNAYETVLAAAMNCEGNFDCDQDQDGSDAFDFKADFGRSSILNPCESGNPCNGDFDCDHDTDGSDAFTFKTDFGRSGFQNPCPACEVGEWCVYE